MSEEILTVVIDQCDLVVAHQPGYDLAQSSFPQPGSWTLQNFGMSVHPILLSVSILAFYGQLPNILHDIRLYPPLWATHRAACL